MAAVTKRDLTGSTANTTSYASASFTPVANELLIVIVHASGSVATDATLTASANGITFSVVGSPLVHTLGGNVSYVFVANQLVGASPVAMTVTFDCTSDAATGAFIATAGVSGMTKVGTAAILQTAYNPNIGANGAYTATFASATNTANPLIGFVAHAGGLTNTPPTGWTEIDEPADQVTPAQGFEWAKADSGQTSTAYTWTASIATVRANVGAIELDTSSSGGGSYVTGAAFSEDFEGAVDGTQASTTTTGFNGVSGAGAQMTHSTLRSILGTRSLRIVNPTTNSYLYNLFSPARNLIYQRVYFYMADFTQGTTVCGVMSGSTQLSNVQLSASAGNFRLRDGATINATSTTVPIIGQWYRIELMTDMLAGTQTARIFTGANLHGTTPNETMTSACSTGTFDRAVVGDFAANTIDWFWDSYAEDPSAYPGPVNITTSPSHIMLEDSSGNLSLEDGLGSLLLQSASGSLSATDNFNRASLGTNWVTTATPVTLDGSQVLGAGAVTSERWKDAVQNNLGAVFAEGKFVGGTLIGPSVAMPGFADGTTFSTSGTWYQLRVTSTAATIVQKDAGAGTFTQLAIATMAINVGDIMRLEYDGTTLNGFINGVLRLQATPGSPLSIAAQPYVGFTHGAGSVQLGTAIFDDWSGGDTAWTGGVIGGAAVDVSDFFLVL